MWVRVRSTISLPYVIPDSEYPVLLALRVRMNLTSLEIIIRINKYPQSEDYHESVVRNTQFRIQNIRLN